MNGIIRLLSIALVAQVILTIVMFSGRESLSAYHSDEPLLSLNWQKVTEIDIEQMEQTPLKLTKKGEQWVLPDFFSFPAASDKVKAFLDKLAAVRKSWPVGSTEVAAKQFRLTQDGFERKISLNTDGAAESTTFYLGTSPSFKKVHAKLANGQESYAIDFGAHEASVMSTDWYDKNFLKVKIEEVKSITLPKFTVVRENEKFTLTGLKEDEELVVEELNPLIKGLTELTFSDVLGIEPKEEFKLESEFLKLTVEANDFSREYTFSGPYEEAFYVLKTSDHPYYFKVSNNVVNSLEKTERTTLVKEKKDESEASTENQEE